MRVFLDECVDWRLSREISGHEVKSARQMGWTAIKNGVLLTLVGREFDVFVTVDRNLSFQQNVTAIPLLVIILHARSNRLADLRPMVPELMRAIESSQRGLVVHLGDKAGPTRR